MVPLEPGQPCENERQHRGPVPSPRLRQGAALRGIASCCIDTSDGLLPALDELATRNRVGVRLEGPAARLLHPEARDAATRASLPAWALLAGPHGEFELVFSLPPGRDAALAEAGRALGWEPVRLGELTDGRGIRIRTGQAERELPAARVRNLLEECDGDPGRCLEALRALDAPVDG